MFRFPVFRRFAVAAVTSLLTSTKSFIMPLSLPGSTTTTTRTSLHNLQSSSYTSTTTTTRITNRFSTFNNGSDNDSNKMRSQPSLFRMSKNDETEQSFIDYQSKVSKSNQQEKDIYDQKQEQQQQQKQQDYLDHQRQVFDEMSEWFKDQEQEVTPDLIPVYESMVKDMITSLELGLTSSTTTTADHDQEKDNTKKTSLRILDVACGTGVLWDFLVDAMTSTSPSSSPTTATTTMPPLSSSLHITGVDLSPSMVEYAKLHAQNLSTQKNETGLMPNNVHIDVHASDIISFCQDIMSGTLFSNSDNKQEQEQEQEQQQQQQHQYDLILFNACFGNFFHPGQVLEAISLMVDKQKQSRKATTSTTTTTTTTTILISHPLGASFVKHLHEKNPQTVPHLLPNSPLDMVRQWTFAIPGITPTSMMIPTSTCTASSSPSAAAASTTTVTEKDAHEQYYLMRLWKDRATTLPQLLRFRGKVDTGYGRGGKKLGVPTANLPASLFQDALETIDPGVYIGYAMIELDTETEREEHDNKDDSSMNSPYPVVVNVGYSPTFEGKENKEKIIEAHLIVELAATNDDEEEVSTTQFLPDFYGQPMRLELSGFLRPEEKFESFPALVEQIHADIAEAKRVLQYGSPYIELKANSPLFVRGSKDDTNGTDKNTPWIGSTGGDKEASWEFVDHLEFLKTID